MNPLLQLMQTAQRGGNPLAMLQQMAGSNPQAAQAYQLLNGKNPQQLQQIATNMARERGTTVEEVARQLGIK